MTAQDLAAPTGSRMLPARPWAARAVGAAL